MPAIETSHDTAVVTSILAALTDQIAAHPNSVHTGSHTTIWQAQFVDHDTDNLAAPHGWGLHTATSHTHTCSQPDWHALWGVHADPDTFAVAGHTAHHDTYIVARDGTEHTRTRDGAHIDICDTSEPLIWSMHRMIGRPSGCPVTVTLSDIANRAAADKLVHSLLNHYHRHGIDQLQAAVRTLDHNTLDDLRQQAGRSHGLHCTDWDAACAWAAAEHQRLVNNIADALENQHNHRQLVETFDEPDAAIAGYEALDTLTRFLHWADGPLWANQCTTLFTTLDRLHTIVNDQAAAGAIEQRAADLISSAINLLEP